MALETKSICDSRFLLPCCRSCEIIKIYPLEFTKSHIKQLGPLPCNERRGRIPVRCFGSPRCKAVVWSAQHFNTHFDVSRIPETWKFSACFLSFKLFERSAAVGRLEQFEPSYSRAGPPRPLVRLRPATARGTRECPGWCRKQPDDSCSDHNRQTPRRACLKGVGRTMPE